MNLDRATQKVVKILLFLLLVTVVFPMTINAQGVAFFSPEEAIKQAENSFRKGEYANVISRLEPLLLSGGGSDKAKSLLFNAYERMVDHHYRNKQFRTAIHLVKKMLTLQPDKQNYIAILHNLFFRGGLFTEGIRYGRALLENAKQMKMDDKSIAQIHGRQAMLYAAIGEYEKMMDELLKASIGIAEDRPIRNYLSNIVPTHLEQQKFLQLLTEAPNVDEALRNRIKTLLPTKTEKLVIKKVTKKEVANDTKLPPSLSVKENMPESIKNTKISDSSTKDEDTDYQSPFQAKVEMYKEFLEEGTRLLKNGDYDGAMRAFDQSSETAPPWMLKKIDRLRFSAYFKKNQPMLEYGGYTVMAVLLILLLWLLGIFRKKGHYDLVSPKKTLAKAARYIEKEKWENAILEYSKIPESTLTREEAIKASLDMALAYMARNSNSNAILHARKVLKRDPGNVDAHLILGKVYIKLKDHTLRAMEIFEFLADRNLANLVMLKALAAYFLKQNQISEKASRIATDIQRYDPDDLTSSQLLARCYHSNNRIDDEALGFMKRITQLLPREVTIKLYLLEIYFRRKNYKEVVREAIGIFPLNVDNIVVHSLFIDSIVRLKQPKMLLTEYNRLSLEYPGSVIVKYLYQSFHSLLVRNRQYPETDISLSLKVNFTVCPRCFHLNLTEFNHCQKCKAQLNP